MILDKNTAEKKLRRMAMEIAERNVDAPNLILIGIKNNGIIIAQKIAGFLQEIFSGDIKVVALSLNKKRPEEIVLDSPVDFNNQTIILIDDVANSGRTFLYALKPLLQSWPHKIETLALVERTHKHFPIAINYVGISVATHKNQNIAVLVSGNDVLGAEMQEA